MGDAEQAGQGCVQEGIRGRQTAVPEERPGQVDEGRAIGAQVHGNQGIPSCWGQDLEGTGPAEEGALPLQEIENPPLPTSFFGTTSPLYFSLSRISGVCPLGARGME